MITLGLVNLSCCIFDGYMYHTGQGLAFGLGALACLAATALCFNEVRKGR